MPVSDGPSDARLDDGNDWEPELEALREFARADAPMFGPYQLLGQISDDRDGKALNTVYEARDPRGTIVALKCLERPRARCDVERFKREAALTRSLAGNGNIVPVSDEGEVDGVPYYTMPFAEGGTLLAWHRAESPAPEKVAGVMAQIAAAVHHAHVNPLATVLHRDLKPSNILMSAEGTPYVADFGVAKRMDRNDTGTRDTLVGTMDYMAPEQVLGDPEKLTPASDVYSLGVVLYELMTDTVPFRDANVGEFLRRLVSAEPIVAPHKLVRGVHRGLEAICLRCLENDPRRRYPSAAALANDLERVRDRKRPRTRPPSRALRAVRWMRRHARATYAAATILAIMVVALGAAGLIWRGRQREQERILDSNASIASGQAGAALFQLREYADQVVALGRHPVVLSILARGGVGRDAPELRPLLGGFDSIMIMTADARVLAQWPSPAPFVYERRYDFRDYFRGTRQMAETRTPGVYVARAFRSESHGTLEFGISTPIVDEHGTFLGLLCGSLNAKAAFGSVRMEEAPQSGRIISALIAPRGNDRSRGPDAGDPTDFVFLVHPGMARGVEYPVPSLSPAVLRQRFGLSAPPGRQLSLQYARALQLFDYRDPIPGFEGEWLAALAPVGKTGFLVLVATRKAVGLP